MGDKNYTLRIFCEVEIQFRLSIRAKSKFPGIPSFDFTEFFLDKQMLTKTILIIWTSLANKIYCQGNDDEHKQNHQLKSQLPSLIIQQLRTSTQKRTGKLNNAIPPLLYFLLYAVIFSLLPPPLPPAAHLHPRLAAAADRHPPHAKWPPWLATTKEGGTSLVRQSGFLLAGSSDRWWTRRKTSSCLVGNIELGKR